MTDSNDRILRTEKRDDQEIGSEAAHEFSAATDLMSDFYREQMSQAAHYQTRIDQTTNWAVTVMAGFLTVVFSSPNIAAYVLLIGVVALCGFLLFETRRYRDYDASRARARILEENLYANTFYPDGAEHDDWRKKLSADLRWPTLKISLREALSRRLKRVYGPLLSILGIAWVLQITIFTPRTPWLESAMIPSVPGVIVVGGVVSFYAGAFILAFWPTSRDAKGEFYGEEIGDWKNYK